MTFSIQCLQCLQGSLNSPVWNSCTEWVRQMNFIHCLAFLSWTQSPCYPVLSLQSVCLKSMPDPSKVITCREDKALLLFSILPFYFKRIGNAADSCSRFHSREQKCNSKERSSRIAGKFYGNVKANRFSLLWGVFTICFTELCKQPSSPVAVKVISFWRVPSRLIQRMPKDGS